MQTISAASPIQVLSGQITLASLGKKNLIFGRPGTGKTHTIQALINAYLSSGERAGANSIMYLTYSKSMARAAAVKFGLPQGTMVGTFHSIMSKYLGWKVNNHNSDESDFLTSEDINSFASKYGLDVNEKYQSSDYEQEGQENFSQLMQAYSYVKNTLGKRKISEVFDTDRFDPDFIIDRYEKMKEDTGRHDYTDILTHSLDLIFDPIKLLIIDEAQDLTPLMWKIVGRIERFAETTVLAGDDMQNIYSFRGASSAEFILNRNSSRIFHLEKSYRLPMSIKKISDIIADKVPIHEEIEFDHNGTEGKVFRWSVDDFLKLDGEKWILCRTSFVAERMARILMRYRLPFLPLNARHSWLSPWSPSLFEIVNSLARFPHLKDHDLERVLDVVPAKYLQRGIKTRVADGEAASIISEYSHGLYGEFDIRYLFRHPLTLDDLLRIIDLKPGKKELIFPYIGKPINEEQIIRLDTIHASKGMEAKNVAVVTDLTSRPKRNMAINPSDEHRIFFTAVTRASSTLSLVHLGVGGVYDI